MCVWDKFESKSVASRNHSNSIGFIYICELVKLFLLKYYWFFFVTKVSFGFFRGRPRLWKSHVVLFSLRILEPLYLKPLVGNFQLSSVRLRGDLRRTLSERSRSWTRLSRHLHITLSRQVRTGFLLLCTDLQFVLKGPLHQSKFSVAQLRSSVWLLYYIRAARTCVSYMNAKSKATQCSSQIASQDPGSRCMQTTHIRQLRLVCKIEVRYQILG